MYDITELKGYFKKIQEALYNAEFSFLGYKFVKKNRIDDLLCCIIAVLPDIFKSALKKVKDVDKKLYPSLLAYSILIKKLCVKFILSQDLYIVSEDEIKELIYKIENHINVDIKKLERLNER